MHHDNRAFDPARESRGATQWMRRCGKFKRQSAADQRAITTIAGCPPRRQQLTLTRPKDMPLPLDVLAAEAGQARPGQLPGAGKLLREGCKGMVA